jgi:hypothetical protein
MESDAAFAAYLSRESTRVTGSELILWCGDRFGPMIHEHLAGLARELGETLFVYPLTRVQTSRGREWQQSWKVLSNGGITFSVQFAVHEREPGVVHLRMTDHPWLWLPPLEVEGMVPLVRRHAPAEIGEAMATVRWVELTGAALFRAKGWGVRRQASAA